MRAVKKTPSPVKEAREAPFGGTSSVKQQAPINQSINSSVEGDTQRKWGSGVSQKPGAGSTLPAEN